MDEGQGGHGNGAPTFWVLGGQTRIDTEALLAANEPLRVAAAAVDECAAALAQAVSASYSADFTIADAPIEEVQWSLGRSLKTVELLREKLTLLLFWRERAAQIYATAEQSVNSFFAGCAGASYASCGQEATLLSNQYRWLPVVSRMFKGIGLGQASAAYFAVMRGDNAGSGAEALHAQIQVDQIAAGILPYLTHRFHQVLFGTSNPPGTNTRVFAALMGGMLARRRSLVGSPNGTTLLTTVPMGGSRSDNGTYAVEFATASRDGVFWRKTAPSSHAGTPAGLASVTSWMLLNRSYDQSVNAGRTPAARLPQSVFTPVRGEHVLRRMEESARYGEIEILRHDNARGRSWSVLVRGTKSWNPFTGNPHDLLSNLQEVGGVGSDQRQTVAAAMTMAGIEPGEPVELVGHSQGGAVVANLVADPDFVEQFNVKTVLTAGAPSGGVGPPAKDVRILSLENLNDIVPALDGTTNRADSGMLTVYFDPIANPTGDRTAGTASAGAHAVETYTAAARALEGNETQGEVNKFFDYRRTALNLGSSTTSTVQYFQTERVKTR